LPFRPLRPVLEPPLDRTAGGVRPATADRGRRLDGLRVLAVDDEAQTRELVREVLSLRGADVRSVPSAEEALAALATACPDVLICDIGMPGRDGYALIGAVRAFPDGERSRVPAIALTAYARTEDRTLGREAGFDAYLAKPVDPAVLCDTIYEVTRGRRPAAAPGTAASD
jgi:CheY-like chemotaxis protein